MPIVGSGAPNYRCEFSGISVKVKAVFPPLTVVTARADSALFSVSGGAPAAGGRIHHSSSLSGRWKLETGSFHCIT